MSALPGFDDGADWGQVGRVAAPLREQVLEILRDAILDFRLRPGQRLIERELIDQLGVSRTTVREALRELAAEGLVATIPQKGVVVTVPSPEEAAEIYEVRAALEGLAARRFVECADDARREALREAFAAFEALVVSGSQDIRELLAAKDALYEALLDGAQNTTIRSVLGGLQARVRLLRAKSLSQPGRPKTSLDELRTIVDALLRGDGEAAADACAEHVAMAARTGLAAVPVVRG